MGSLEVERKTIGWAARDPSGVLSPYTYTLRFLENIYLIHSINTLYIYFMFLTFTFWYVLNELIEILAQKIYLSRLRVVGFAILIFTRSRMILELLVIPWFQGMFLIFVLALFLKNVHFADFSVCDRFC